MSSAPPTKRNTTFKGDVLRLVSGTGLAQIIGLLAAPILTRLYAPEAYGIAALFASITGILGVLACMRYELSIVLPDNDREAANLLAVSLSFSILIALLSVPVIWLGGAYILDWMDVSELAPYIWLVPIMVLVSGIFSALNYWNTRTKHFTRLSIARVTSAVAATSTSFGAGLAGHASGGAMISASIAGQTVATAILGGQIWRDNGRFILSSLTGREMWRGIKRHRKFPLYSTWGALINTASWQLPILLLGAFFSPVIVGFYALGFRILQLPMSFIGGAIGQVFLQRASVAREEGTVDKLVMNLLEKLLVLSLLPMLIVTVIGQELFILIFGVNWGEAGYYAQILSVWAILWFISSPLSSVVLVFEKMEKELFLSSLSFVLRIAAITIGGIAQEPRLAIILFAVAGMISYGYLLKTIFDLCGIKPKTLMTRGFKLLFRVMWFLIIIIAFEVLEFSAVALLISSVLLLLGYYYLNRKTLLGGYDD